jgi:hypothetical protein
VTDRLWIALLVYPAPLYAAVLIAYQFTGSGVGVTVGFLAALVFGTATGLGLLRLPLAVWVGRLAFVLFVLFVLSNDLGPSGGIGLDLAAGVIIGAPFLWLEYAWRDSTTPTARVVALQSTFVLGILVLATGTAASAAGSGAGGWSFFESLWNVLSGQLQGIATLFSGGTPNGIPLESTLDVNYVALGAVALLGVILSWISPRTALEEPLPWSWARSRPATPAETSLAEELGLRPGQRDALATRSRPISPDAMFAPGFGALIVTCLLLAGFITLAVAAPSYALLVLVLGTVGALVAVGVVLGRRLTPIGGLEG